MSKYAPLRRHLEECREMSLTMLFSEIDDLVGGLPESARRYTTWWSNEIDGRHVQAHAWMDAGWRVDNVNLTAERVRLIRM